jgi:HPt (histidine-containing phosphotransfer) domain-containing protein
VALLSEVEPVIDPAAIARLTRIGGTNLARQMLELFMQLAPERITLAEAGYAAQDMKQVEQATHSLKSSAGNLGAIRLQHAATACEAAAEAGDTGALAPLMTALRAEYDAAHDALAGTLAEMAE